MNNPDPICSYLRSADILHNSKMESDLAKQGDVGHDGIATRLPHRSPLRISTILDLFHIRTHSPRQSRTQCPVSAQEAPVT